MKFTCRTDNLTQKLAIVSKAIPIKHSFPLLTHVLIEAKDGRVKLSGTNLDTSITVFVGASVEEEGSITIPARHLLEFLSNLTEETLVATLIKDTLHIQAGATKSRFTGVAASNYPELPEFESASLVLEIDAKTLFSAVSSVAFAVALDETRPVFSGIYIKLEDNKLILAASDGYRLSEHTLILEDYEGEDFSLVLPARAFIEIVRILNSCDEPAKVYINNNTNLCLFECDDIFMSSRVVDGTYPDYKRIIPVGGKLQATFLAQSFLEAVKLTHVFTKNSGNMLSIYIDPAGFLRVGSSDQEVGENTTEIPAEVTGDGLEIVFNAKYLLEFLSNNKHEKLIFIANDATSPCILSPSDNETFVHVLAPMQLNGR